jgi:hypothetical protein
MSGLALVREKLAKDTEPLFGAINVAFADTTELERQLLATFAFGIVYAEGRTNGLSAAQVHALSITVLINTFKYSPEQAAAFAEHLIDVAADRDVHPTMNAIIHEGIDGHEAMGRGDTAAVTERIDRIFTLLGAAGA